MKHLVIIDGMGFVFRAYHAVRGNLTRADGMPTNALFGLAQMLVKVVDDLKPDECVVALDSKGKNWRHDMYLEYKANRPPPEEALARQLEFVEPMIQAFGLPVLRQNGVEADDIIATLVARGQAEGEKVTIVTSDKDLLQLVGNNVFLLDTLKDKVSNVLECVEKFGVGPDLVVDVQGLMGDSSDNIPGVPGIGPKTAGDLVGRFGALEQVYAHLEEIKSENVRKKLVDFKEQAFLSRELAKLRKDVVLEAVDMTFHPHLHEAVEYLRDVLEFKTLAARLEKRRERKSGESEVLKRQPLPVSALIEHEPVPNLGTRSEEQGTRKEKDGWGSYECVLSEERWQWWLAEARRRGVVAFDTETTGLDPYVARLVGVSLALGVGEACYVPLKGYKDIRIQGYQEGLFEEKAVEEPVQEGVMVEVILAGLRELLADAAVLKVGHNLKYDWLVVARALGVIPDETGRPLQELIVNFDDTMLMSGCADGGRWRHGMDDLVERHLGHKMIAYEEVCGKGKAAVTFDKVPLDKATAYAAEDADATWRLWEFFRDRLGISGMVGGNGERTLKEELAAMPSGRPAGNLSGRPLAAKGNGNLDEALRAGLRGESGGAEDFDENGSGVEIGAASPPPISTPEHLGVASKPVGEVGYLHGESDEGILRWEKSGAALPPPDFSQREGVSLVGAASFGPAFVYAGIERPLLPVIVAMEARGVRVDAVELKALSAEFGGKMAALEDEIWRLAGREFNVQSTQQLAVVLFDELGVGSEKMKKSRSTSVDVLEALAEGEEGSAGVLVARGMVEYRKFQKLRSTYTEALREQVSAVTGRVHTSYNQLGAATGRFSSTDPNLQNIPVRNEEGRKIRKAFVPKAGWTMLSADYSQIELRLLAHFSGSQALRKAFVEGLDIHAYTASLVRGVPLAEVTKEQRRAAKFINFGLVYGMGARSLAGQMGASMSEAQEWINAYFARYDGVRDYMEANKRQAREKGYVETLCGRRVWLPEINSSNGGLRSGAERAAINAPLQGSNADVIKLAMCTVEEGLKGGTAAQLLMQVHDELVLECAPEAVEELRTMLPVVMGGVVSLSVPLAVEVGVGKDWDGAH